MGLSQGVRPHNVPGSIVYVHNRLAAEPFSPDMGAHIAARLKSEFRREDPQGVPYLQFTQTLLRITPAELYRIVQQLEAEEDRDAFKRYGLATISTEDDVQRFYAAFFAAVFQFWSGVPTASRVTNYKISWYSRYPSFATSHTCFHQLTMPPALPPTFPKFLAMIAHSIGSAP